MAAVGDDDVGGDGRDDDESVSRGGTPAPLSDGSGATPGDGGSRAARRARRASARVRAGQETRRRAATMAARAAAAVQATAGCVRGRAGRNAVRGLVSRRGLRMINVRLGGRVNRTLFRGSWAISYRGRHAAVVMTSARPTRGTMWATTWARILDHCADMNGAPLTRTPPRQSWGRGPSHPRGWRRIQARWSTCLLLLAVQRRRVESLVLGALSSPPVHRALVLAVRSRLNSVTFITYLLGGGEEESGEQHAPQSSKNVTR